jgi:hypothetical protein
MRHASRQEKDFSSEDSVRQKKMEFVTLCYELGWWIAYLCERADQSVKAAFNLCCVRSQKSIAPGPAMRNPPGLIGRQALLS